MLSTTRADDVYGSAPLERSMMRTAAADESQSSSTARAETMTRASTSCVLSTTLSPSSTSEYRRLRDADRLFAVDTIVDARLDGGWLRSESGNEEDCGAECVGGRGLEPGGGEGRTLS